MPRRDTGARARLASEAARLAERAAAPGWLGDPASLSDAEAADAEVRLVTSVVRESPDAAPPVGRSALAGAVRRSLRVLEERHPGHLVEVRVPPFAAVQIGIPGVNSVHRRGTPPNVVETDAATWLLLASGDLTWADALAAHRVSASGAHAQLDDLLPLR